VHPAQTRGPFENKHTIATFGQLPCSGKPGNATAQNYNIKSGGGHNFLKEGSMIKSNKAPPPAAILHSNLYVMQGEIRVFLIFYKFIIVKLDPYWFAGFNNFFQ